jgi:excisionase family DNA binding protein
MSSNIRVTRICQRCGQEFEARTTVTRYCGDHCSKRAYKERVKAEKIRASEAETKEITERPKQVIKEKEFLSVRDVAILLNSSRQTVYDLIDKGKIKAVNLGERKTLIRRIEIDKLFA